MYSEIFLAVVEGMAFTSRVVVRNACSHARSAPTGRASTVRAKNDKALQGRASLIGVKDAADRRECRWNQACAPPSFFLMRTGARFFGASVPPSVVAAAFFLGAGLSVDSPPAAASARSEERRVGKDGKS